MSKDAREISTAETAEISAALKSALAPLAAQQGDAHSAEFHMASQHDRDMGYPVADLVGRCFLRVCFWIDICTSWAKKYHPPTFTFESSKAQTPAMASGVMAAPVLDAQPTIGRSQTH